MIYKSQLSKSKVISFDIFDTLLTRKCSSPTHIFNFMREDVRLITNNKIENFRSARIDSQRQAEKISEEMGVQDVTLKDIYNILSSSYDLSETQAERIKDLEISREVESVIQRRAGFDIYNEARKTACYIILVSDMYLPREVIEKMLSKIGVDYYDKLYLSSEIGLTKKTGDLFDFVMNDLKVSPNEIVHFGDNFKGDYKSAIEKKVSAVHLPRSYDNFNKAFKSVGDFSGKFNAEATRTSSYLLSLIQDYSYDDIDSNRIGFNGDLKRFACTAIGPLGVGFASWLHNEAVRDNVKKLYFLSRDGLILKKAYDILYPNSSIETHYIKASRKIVKLASIYSVQDIEARVRGPIYATTIDRWLENNFGLTEDQTRSIDYLSYGYVHQGSHSIGNKTDRDSLFGLCASVSDVIIANSASIRNKYNCYLADVGMDKDSGVVDIGYAGSMQAYFNKVISNDVSGYYLATFDTYLRKFDYLDANSYLNKCSSSKDSRYSICTHRFVYEALLCSSETSFVCFEPNEAGYIERLPKDSGLGVREEIVDKCHNLLVEFWKEFYTRFDVENNKISLSSSLSTLMLDQFLVNPYPADAKLLQGIIFEDAYGPAATRYILAPKDVKVASSNIIWREGEQALNKKLTSEKNTSSSKPGKNSSFSEHVSEQSATVAKSSDNSGNAMIVTCKNKIRRSGIALEDFLVKHTSNVKQYNKYKRDRDLFFLDSKSKLVREYYKKSRRSNA